MNFSAPHSPLRGFRRHRRFAAGLFALHCFLLSPGAFLYAQPRPAGGPQEAEDEKEEDRRPYFIALSIGTGGGPSVAPSGFLSDLFLLDSAVAYGTSTASRSEDIAYDAQIDQYQLAKLLVRAPDRRASGKAFGFELFFEYLPDFFRGRIGFGLSYRSLTFENSCQGGCIETTAPFLLALLPQARPDGYGGSRVFSPNAELLYIYGLLRSEESRNPGQIGVPSFSILFHPFGRSGGPYLGGSGGVGGSESCPGKPGCRAQYFATAAGYRYKVGSRLHVYGQVERHNILLFTPTIPGPIRQSVTMFTLGLGYEF